jgi:hypothetical protein
MLMDTGTTAQGHKVRKVQSGAELYPHRAGLNIPGEDPSSVLIHIIAVFLFSQSNRKSSYMCFIDDRLAETLFENEGLKNTSLSIKTQESIKTLFALRVQ